MSGLDRAELLCRIGEYGDARVSAALAQVEEGRGPRSGMHEVEANRIAEKLAEELEEREWRFDGEG